MSQMTLKRLLLGWWPVQFFIERVLPKIRFSTWYPSLSTGAFAKFNYTIQEGDIVFSTDSNKLAHFLIPGEWDHVGIVVKHEDQLMIVEAVQPKVRFTDTYTFCSHSDRIAIARPKLDPEALERFVRYAKMFVGMKYDSLFTPGREALYCAEVIIESWPAADAIEPLGADMTDEAGLGVTYAVPDDIWNATGLKQVWRSDEKTLQSN